MKSIIITLLLACTVLPVSATNESYEFFKDFIEEGIDNNTFQVTDFNGNDMTDEFKMIYNSGDVMHAYEYISNNSMTIGYTEKVIHNRGIALLSNEEAITKSNKKLYTKKKPTGNSLLSWTTTLTGTYYINSANGKVIRASKPGLVLTNKSVGVSITVSNTSYSIGSKSVTYNAKYRAYYNENGSFDLGTYTHSFNA